MRIDYIREFINLAEELNYTRSATRLFTSQSVLSRHIKNMEEELGVKLFERSTHDVQLTDAGHIAFTELRNMIERYDALLDKLSLSAKGDAGYLRFGIIYYAIESYLDNIVHEIERLCPGAYISIRSFQSPELWRDLLARKIDLGLTYRASLPKDQALCISDVCKERMVVVFPTDHRLSGLKTVSAQELGDETFVFMKSEKWHELYVKPLLSKYIPGELKCIYTEQIDTLASSAISMNAVAIVAEHDANAGWRKLSSALIEEEDFNITVSLAHMADNDNPTLTSFMRKRCLTE
ncbi:MAG: LysR family transcriptional regulator [Clostridiales bacterium]|nr:LysR family transcriptional regulator [Clostridiales bacterium]